MHIFPKKKGKKLPQTELVHGQGINQLSENADQSSSASSSAQMTNGYVSKTEPTAETKISARSLSPYPKVWNIMDRIDAYTIIFAHHA